MLRLSKYGGYKSRLTFIVEPALTANARIARDKHLMSKLTLLFRMGINNTGKCFVIKGIFMTFAAVKKQ